jgi:8-oxo-dGTP pyrophosphatase MutT (NUDIX family)
VLVPVVLRDEGPTVLLTLRTSHLRDHAGQISFPGGRTERDDGSAEETALREAEEEVGLHRRHVQIIGRLPQFLTITGFVVTPVIGLINPPFDLQPDDFEVAEVFVSNAEKQLYFSSANKSSLPLDSDSEHQQVWILSNGQLYVATPSPKKEADKVEFVLKPALQPKNVQEIRDELI